MFHLQMLVTFSLLRYLKIFFVFAIFARDVVRSMFLAILEKSVGLLKKHRTHDTRHTSHEFLHTIFPFRLGRPTTKVDDPCTWQSSVLSFFQCASCCSFSRLSTPENDPIPVSSRPSDRTVRPESEGKNPGSLRVHRKSSGIERSSSSG